jgi:GT2 family glycosyltransferase
MNERTAMPRPTFSVVMPVYNARHYLERSLPPLSGVEDPRLIELIVVDDGSTDESRALAGSLGAKVLDSGGSRLGPAAARNVGMRAARGEVVVFVDADVVPRADAISRIADAFDAPEVVAVYGAYDDHPPFRGFASQYMNLRHHHVHQTPSDDAQTFWAGLGAVRRQAFLDVGGFDAARFPEPSIEDIELGMRLRRAGGRIRRLPGIQGTHLKQWSLRGVIRTDFRQRALPWARLIHENPGAFTDLNVQGSERAKALLAGAFWLSVGLALAGRAAPWFPLALLALAGWVNRDLLAVFHRRNGAWFSLRALVFHQLYYSYAAAAYAWSLVHRQPCSAVRT